MAKNVTGFKSGAIAIMTIAATAFSAQAAVWNNWTGKGDPNRPFSDDANWTYPVAGTRLQNFNCDLYITNEVEKAAFESIEMWYVSGKGRVIWDFPTNTVCYAHLYTGGGTGSFVKRGAGSVQMLPSWVDRYDCSGPITVEEGELRLPDYSSADYQGATKPSSADFSYGSVVVSNGAKLVCAKMANASTAITHVFGRLSSGPTGIVTNDNDSARHILRVTSIESNPSCIYGPVGGNIQVQGNGSLYLYNESNTFTSLSPTGDDPNRQSVMGLAKIGNSADAYSSMGYGTGKSLDWNRNYGGVIFKYLGDGETTDRPFAYGYSSTEYTRRGGLDGGPNGGLRLTGLFQPSLSSTGDEAYHVDLVLTGDNAKPCVIDSAFAYVSCTKTGQSSVTHFTKRGTGAWLFTHLYNSSTSGRICTFGGLTGGMSIEDGAIQFESYGDEGEFCALGAGIWNGQFGEYQGLNDWSKLVPWTYSLGTADADGTPLTEGTFESVCTNTALSSRRPFVLQGNGRFKSSGSGRLCLRDVKPRSAGEKTLTLDGTNTLGNAVTEVSDASVVGATISVVKEGEGKWILNGNQTFHGDLVVKAGTLEVNADASAFSWFKFTQVKGGGAIRMSEFGLYDVDGNRINKNLTHPANIPSPAGGTKGFIFNDYAELAPGQCTYGRMGPYVFYTSNGGPKCLFDNSTTDTTIMPDTGSGPTVSNSMSQISVVFRLAEGAAEAASYDIGFGNYQYWFNAHPRSWRIEGSRDGYAWEILTNVNDYAEANIPTADSQWYSDKTSVTTTGARPYPHCGFPLRGNLPVSSLPNVRRVRVDKGATLSTTYANVGSISNLQFAVTGGGTISGFAFAPKGKIDFVGEVTRGKQLSVAYDLGDGATAANVADWEYTINGAADSHFTVVAGPKGAKLVPKGLAIIIR